MCPNFNHDVIRSIRNVVHANETKLTWSRETCMDSLRFSNNLSQVHSSASGELILLAVLDSNVNLRNFWHFVYNVYITVI
jgi:hypothetical protein